MLLNWVPEKTLESPLDCEEIQPVHPKGNQSWIFIRRTDAEAEAPILWPPDAKNWLIGKDPDAGKDWRQEEKGTTRGWEGWMASPTQWTWVWVDSGSWWWTGRPVMLQSLESTKSWTWLSDRTITTVTKAARWGLKSQKQIRHNFRMNLPSYTPASCCKLLYNTTPPPPPAPQSNSLRVTLDAVSQAWSPKNSHRVKHNSQLLGHDYF